MVIYPFLRKPIYTPIYYLLIYLYQLLNIKWEIINLIQLLIKCIFDSSVDNFIILQEFRQLDFATKPKRGDESLPDTDLSLDGENLKSIFIIEEKENLGFENLLIIIRKNFKSLAC